VHVTSGGFVDVYIDFVFLSLVALI
jgi:hypothetical protein